MKTITKQKKRELLLKFHSHLHERQNQKKPAPVKRLMSVIALRLFS